MTQLADLLQKQRDIETRIAQARLAQRQVVLNEVRKLMVQHGLTLADVAGRQSTGAPTAVRQGTRRPVAAKYQDKQGNTWSGRGLKPKWLVAALQAGGRLEDFAVPPKASLAA